MCWLAKTVDCELFSKIVKDLSRDIHENLCGFRLRIAYDDGNTLITADTDVRVNGDLAEKVGARL